MPETPRMRVRYDRIGALVLSAGVTVLALLAGIGVIDAGVGAAPAYADGVAPTSAAVRAHATGGALPVVPAAARLPGPRVGRSRDAVAVVSLPARSGEGRRVVFDMSAQRVWLVSADGTVRRSYPVSGSLTDNLRPGQYAVYSRSRWAVGIEESGAMRYFVRFAHGARAAIGFHDIPVRHGVPLQTTAQLGTPQSHGCIRQARPDAIALWRFAPTGTEVVVVA